MQQQNWISDSELVDELGMGWIEEVSLSDEDFSPAGKKAMLEIANNWLAAHGHPHKVVDCMDDEDEMLWLME